MSTPAILPRSDTPITPFSYTLDNANTTVNMNDIGFVLSPMSTQAINITITAADDISSLTSDAIPSDVDETDLDLHPR